MESESNGYVIVNFNHPAGVDPYILSSTFSGRKKDAIQKFIEGSGASWRYWYRKYSFRCVKATSIISLIN